MNLRMGEKVKPVKEITPYRQNTPFYCSVAHTQIKICRFWQTCTKKCKAKNEMKK